MIRTHRPQVTRTQNPLPFEHMEPKRFEDMVRQLAYDFKPWRQLEATGRSGDDGGFDARGFEAVESTPVSIELPSEEDTPLDTAADKLWLIQCKRERKIGPAQMKKHLEGILESSRQGLYGVLFVAACDFSLESRNVLRDWCRSNGITECIIWGRGELEDLLFQPKNDGLLFAYFGISLRIARQKLASDLRREIAIKRKRKRLIPDERGAAIILRDPSDSRYPYVEGETLKDHKSLWLPRHSLGIGVFGLRIVVRKFWAFYEWESQNWDFASAIDYSMSDINANESERGA